MRQSVQSSAECIIGISAAHPGCQCLYPPRASQPSHPRHRPGWPRRHSPHGDLSHSDVNIATCKISWLQFSFAWLFWGSLNGVEVMEASFFIYLMPNYIFRGDHRAPLARRQPTAGFPRASSPASGFFFRERRTARPPNRQRPPTNAHVPFSAAVIFFSFFTRRTGCWLLSACHATFFFHLLETLAPEYYLVHCVLHRPI